MIENLATERMISSLLLGTIRQEINVFIVDRKALNLSENTIMFYLRELTYFADFLESRQVFEVKHITPNDIRAYLIHLEQRRNSGGVHASYRSIRAFLNWWDEETDHEYPNPIKKVKRRPPPVQPIKGVEISEIKKMLKFCAGRDAVIIRALLDTGARATELASIRVSDIDIATGAVVLNTTKGGQIRTVYLGRNTLREAVKYLRKSDPGEWLFPSERGGHLTREGIDNVLVKVATLAGIPRPSPHDFRRCCALTLLRNGMDLLSVSRYLGHQTLNVTRRYLAQVEDDIAAAHSKASPGDML